METALVGRRAELASASALLRASPGLVSVVGVAGIGKSRLVRELAASWPCAAVVVDLTDVAGREALIEVLARALGVRTEEPASRIAGVASALAARQGSRLVLDPFDALVDGAASVVREILNGAPNASVLVATRRRLRLGDERVVELGGLPEAVTLLLERIRLLRPDLTPNDHELKALEEIARALDGIPLALEIAAHRAAVLGIDALALTVRDGAHLSMRGPADGPTRHRTMRDAIGGSWETLSDRERSVLTTCAAFRGGFAIEDVVAVSPDEPDVLDVLQGLREASMIVADDASRLRLLGLIRDFAVAHSSPGTLATATSRHASHFERAARSRASTPDWLGREWENLAAALAHALTDDAKTEAACALLSAIAETGLRSGRSAELLAPCDVLLSRTGGDPTLRARLLVLRSRIAQRRGERTVADANLEEARTLAEGCGDGLLLGEILRRRSFRLARDARLGESRVTFAEARALDAREHSPRSEEVGALSSSLRQGLEFARARVVVEQSLAAVKEPRARAVALQELVLAELELGSFERGARVAAETLAYVRALGWTTDEARALLLSGVAELAIHRDEPCSDAALRAALACAEESGAAPVAAYARLYLGVRELLLGNPSIADEWFATSQPPDGGHLALIASYRSAAAAQLDEPALAEAFQRETARDDVAPCLAGAIALNGVHLQLARARATRGARAPSAMRSAIRRARAQVDAIERRGADTHLALGMALGAIRRHEDLASAGSRVELLVHDRGDWFALGEGARIDLSGQTNVKRALLELVRARARSPSRPLSAEALIARLWPGEAMLERAAKNRLHVTLANLRRAGLRELLLSDAGGYRLNDRVAIHLAREDSAAVPPRDARESAP